MNLSSNPYRQRHRRRSVKRARVLITAATPSVLAASRMAGAQAAGLPALTCSAHTLPVRIADPRPAGQTMWGQPCLTRWSPAW